MSNSKKRPERSLAPTQKGRPAASGRRSHAATPLRPDPGNRRKVTFGIVAGGLLIAVWVLVSSLNAGGNSVAQSGAQGTAAQSQPTVDAKSLDAAIAALMQKAQQNPSDLTTIVDLANRFYDAGRYGEAIPWYEKAILQVPNNTDIRTDLGTSYFYSGNFDKAKENWFKALEQDPNKVETHYNLSVMYTHQTPPDTDSAIKEWQTVVRIAPDSEQGKSAAQKLKDAGQ